MRTRGPFLSSIPPYDFRLARALSFSSFLSFSLSLSLSLFLSLSLSIHISLYTHHLFESDLGVGEEGAHARPVFLERLPFDVDA